jgi:hypothetical protein
MLISNIAQAAIFLPLSPYGRGEEQASRAPRNGSASPTPPHCPTGREAYDIPIPE